MLQMTNDRPILYVDEDCTMQWMYRMDSSVIATILPRNINLYLFLLRKITAALIRNNRGTVDEF